MPKFNTLIQDIYKIFDSPHELSEDSLELFCENIKESLRDAFEKRQDRGEKKLRLSKIGLPSRRLWFDLRGQEFNKKVLENIDNLAETLKIKVIEVDKRKKKVVFSERAVSEAKEIEEAGIALKKVEIDKVYDGVITTITSFGIFVKIKADKSDIEGLVHISELSWEKIERPSEVFKLGQKVKVKVLGIRDGKLALSLKQAQENPWENVSKKFKVDDKVKGTVTKNSDFGTFVKLAPGIEGLIHITKIPPATKLNVGDAVNCYIEEIDTKNKRISLGLILSVKPVGYK